MGRIALALFLCIAVLSGQDGSCYDRRVLFGHSGKRSHSRAGAAR